MASKFYPRDIVEDHFEQQAVVAAGIIKEYRLHVDDPEYRQRWNLIPARRLARIWNDYMSLKWVRDEHGIDQIAGTVLDNILKMEVNTILCEHTQTSPEAFAEGIFDEPFPEGFFERNVDFFEDERGSLRISDFALRDLSSSALDLRMAGTAESKLQTVDYILSLVHPRSDLAGWFVEGGTRTLTSLAGTAV